MGTLAEGNGRKAHGAGQKAGAWRIAWKVDDEGLNIQPEIE
jgi:hypothetical protein